MKPTHSATSQQGKPPEVWSFLVQVPAACWAKGSPWVKLWCPGSCLSCVLQGGWSDGPGDPSAGVGCQDPPQLELQGKSKHSGQAETIKPTYDKCLKMLLCGMRLWDNHCCQQFLLHFCVNSQRQKCKCWRKCWWKMSHLCLSGSSVRSRNWTPDVAFRD